MTPFDKTSTLARERIADHILRNFNNTPSSYLDLLLEVLERSKHMAGLIWAGSTSEPNVVLTDIGGTACVLQDHIETALILVNTWVDDSRKASAGKGGDKSSSGRS
jgi:hypothetical protein